ncbi:MAG: hypothetical protein HKO65_06275, partial [Gemmatimonadetes bacterium]|nr:hypothetical protein [Gemmatimonadota bacterium]
YHLWHGDLSHRGYRERYPGLAPYGFDPEKDIAKDGRGVWRWASERPDLQEYVSSYFGPRKEDG